MQLLLNISESEKERDKGIQTWKDILGYDYPYQVSNLGNVRLLDRPTCPKSQTRKDRNNIKPGRIMPQRIRTGYQSVSFRLNKRSKEVVVHILVAIYFIPNPDNKPVVNHINGIKTDNKVENLEWVTISENVIHAVNTGLMPVGEKHRWSRLKPEDVIEIRELSAGGMATNAIARKFGVWRNAIYRIIIGKNWKQLKSA